MKKILKNGKIWTQIKRSIKNNANVTFKNLDAFHLALFGIPFFLGAFGIYFNSRPYTYVVRGEPTVICSNGKEYPTDPNGIDAQKLQNYIQNGQMTADAQAQDARTKELCAYGIVNSFIPFLNVPQDRNYSVRTGISVSSLDISQNSGVTLSHE